MCRALARSSAHLTASVLARCALDAVTAHSPLPKLEGLTKYIAETSYKPIDARRHCRADEMRSNAG